MASTRLHDQWKRTASNYSKDNDLIERFWNEIETAYTFRKRVYHDLEHLDYMLEHAESNQSNIENYDCLIFSIFYHDIVYSIRRKDNEIRSATLAVERLTALGVPAETIECCRKQIMATRHLERYPDYDTRYLADIDLAILGEERKVYRRYMLEIRKEFGVFPDFMFNKGRKKFLMYFLNQDRIYQTDEYFEKYEDIARENLKWELVQLSNVPV